MERKVWIFAAIGFVGALAFYKTSANHSAVVDGGRLNRLARLNALLDEGKTEYRPAFFRKHPRIHVEHEQVAGLAPVAASEAKAPTEKDAKTKAAEAKALADKKAADKKAADKKKADEDKKKKKKKKHAKDGGALDRSGDESADDTKDDKKTDDAGGGSGLDEANNGPSKLNPSKNPNELSADEWFTLLSQNPSFEKFQKFMQLRQINIVKSDTFYSVVEKLLLTDVDQLHNYAASALDANPSFQSFSLLFAVKGETTMNDSVRKASTTYLEKYGRLELVRILASAASAQTQDPGMSYYAISLIQKTASANLSSLTQSADPTEQSTNRSPAAAIVSLYESIALTMHSVATTSTNSTVASNAGQAAATIDSLLRAAPASAASTSTTVLTRN